MIKNYILYLIIILFIIYGLIQINEGDYKIGIVSILLGIVNGLVLS